MVFGVKERNKCYNLRATFRPVVYIDSYFLANLVSSSYITSSFVLRNAGLWTSYRSDMCDTVNISVLLRIELVFLFLITMSTYKIMTCSLAASEVDDLPRLQDDNIMIEGLVSVMKTTSP